MWLTVKPSDVYFGNAMSIRKELIQPYLRAVFGQLNNFVKLGSLVTLFALSAVKPKKTWSISSFTVLLGMIFALNFLKFLWIGSLMQNLVNAFVLYHCFQTL